MGFGGLYEERAILLSRVNKHHQALNIYVHKLKRPDLAEKYCKEHYGKNEESKDIFLVLLRINLDPQNGEEPNIDEAIKILERHFDKINSLEVRIF